MRKSIVSSSSLQTKNIAKALAQTLLETQPKKGARVLALAGELGSGKTTFTQGLAKGLGIKERILSPTFLIMRKFEIPASAKASAGKQNPKSETNSKFQFQNFYHIDCYRLDSPEKELLRLGFQDIIQNPRNIVVIEWADRIKSILPRDTLWTVFSSLGAKRKIDITIV